MTAASKAVMESLATIIIIPMQDSTALYPFPIVLISADLGDIYIYIGPLYGK